MAIADTVTKKSLDGLFKGNLKNEDDMIEYPPKLSIDMNPQDIKLWSSRVLVDLLCIIHIIELNSDKYELM